MAEMTLKTTVARKVKVGDVGMSHVLGDRLPASEVERIETHGDKLHIFFKGQQFYCMCKPGARWYVRA